MREVFAELLGRLNEGYRAALVSEYDGAGVARSLVCESEREAWNSLERGKECVSLSSADGKLTLTEWYASRPRLVILGGGHIALPLSHIGARLGFRVLVYDDRPSFAHAARFPDAEAVVCESFDMLTKRVPIQKNDAVVIVTRGHRHDRLCLQSILDGGEFPRYLGMMGSRRRVAIVKKQLEAETGETEKLARLHSPIGLAIGAVTPEEIAISIFAELIQELRLGSGEASGGDPRKPWQCVTPDMQLLAWLAEGRTEKAALATVVHTQGSTPREIGAKMAILESGGSIGSIGGGCAEAEVMKKARECMQNGGHCLVDIDLTDAAEEDGMVCGGAMKVLVEALACPLP